MRRARPQVFNWRSIAGLATGVVLVTIGELLSWLLLRSQGVVVSGDSPHYLIAAEAIARHLSVHPLSAYVRDFRLHKIYAWPPGASVATVEAVKTYTHTWFGPHGVVFAQGIGLPVLLAPFIALGSFMALGSVPLALVGFFAVEATGLVYIYRRGSDLAGLGRLGRVVFAIALFGPSVWLASTQIYPDFIAGVFLGCALVEIAAFERTGRFGWRGVAVVSTAFCVVPWFQIKNFSVVVLGVVALVVIGVVRQKTERRYEVALIAGVAAGSFLLLVLYNQFYFGHVLGLPQPNPNFGVLGITHTIDLVVDRDQGALVQCPVLLVGVLGLFFSRKESPVTNVLVVASVGSILVINGTQPTYNDFGGLALAGRFEWTVVPMVLAWCPSYLRRLEARRRRLLALGVALGGLWVVEATPILTGGHRYFNETFAPFAPWDPSLYPGWWRGLDPYLPSIVTPFNVKRVVLVCVIVVIATLLLMWLVLARRFLGTTSLVALGVGGVLIVAIGPSSELPAGALRWSGNEIGGPWTAASATARYGPTPLTPVGAGVYKVTLNARLVSGSSSSTDLSLYTSPVERNVVSNWFTPTEISDAGAIVVRPAKISLARRRTTTVAFTADDRGTWSGSKTVYVHVYRRSMFSIGVAVSPSSTLSVTSVEVRKLAN